MIIKIAELWLNDSMIMSIEIKKKYASSLRKKVKNMNNAVLNHCVVIRAIIQQSCLDKGFAESETCRQFIRKNYSLLFFLLFFFCSIPFSN